MFSEKQIIANISDHVLSTAWFVCRKLQEYGYEAYIVGGCVRDIFLNRVPHDWDITTNALPTTVAKLFDKVIPTGEKHGTMTVLVDGRAIEVTTFRSDGNYSDGRRPNEVKFGVSLIDDLRRRDFTANAIALDPIKGRFVDPFDGVLAIKRKLIAAVGNAEDRFREDGLRVMRALRFSAQLGFEIGDATLIGISTCADMLSKVSEERKRDEIFKLLDSDSPSSALQKMMSLGVMKYVIPELLPSFEHAQNEWHRFDVWTHTCVTVDNTSTTSASFFVSSGDIAVSGDKTEIFIDQKSDVGSNGISTTKPIAYISLKAKGDLISRSNGDSIRRLGALLHDVGKPATAAPAEGRPGFSFHQHDKVGAEISQGICDRLKLSNDQKQRVCGMVEHHMVSFGATDANGTDLNKTSIRKYIRRYGTDLLEDLLALRIGDVVGKGLGEGEAVKARIAAVRDRIQKVLEEKPPFRIKDMSIDGNDVMTALSLSPGPAVGKVLAALFEKVMEDPTLNERERLMALLPDISSAVTLAADCE